MNDKPQKISAFAFRQSSTVAETTQQAKLNLFTNVPRFSGASSLNVILLDSLNAEYLSRTYGRDQLLKYLESGPAIQPTPPSWKTTSGMCAEALNICMRSPTRFITVRMRPVLPDASL